DARLLFATGKEDYQAYRLPIVWEKAPKKEYKITQAKIKVLSESPKPAYFMVGLSLIHVSSDTILVGTKTPVLRALRVIIPADSSIPLPDTAIMLGTDASWKANTETEYTANVNGLA